MHYHSDELQNDAKSLEPDMRDTYTAWFHVQKMSGIGKYMKTDID